MIERIIEGSVRHRVWVLLGVVVLIGWALDSMRRTPLDAIPDLSDPQVIVYAEWMGRSPDLVEDQITYPIVRALQSTPGVRSVRGYSMFGMSFVYAIFDDRTDPYWARTRVVEQLARAQAQLPPGVAPTLGPDASGVGWIYQYVLLDRSGRLDLAELRALQDYVVRPALQAVQGVAEVAAIGGFERQYQVLLDPHRLAAFDISPGDVARALQQANAEIGARVVEEGGREFVLRGRGYVASLADIEAALVRRGPGGAPITIGDVAEVRFGPEIRRGAADLDGTGEVAGGIVVMRLGANALQVIRGVRAQIDTLRLPDGVELVPTYDRSLLIEGSIATLRDTLLKETAVIVIVSLVFLMHVRSALVAVVILPISVLLSFIAIRHLGLTSNIMSLGGIAIALVELADAVIVMVENAHRRLVAAGRDADRRRIIVDACKEVGRPIFFSTVLLTVSFLPVFALGGQAGRLFDPLAWTKTFAMLSASVLTITLAPVLMVWLLRGRLRAEHENPVARLLHAVYAPIARRVVWHRRVVLVAAVAVVVATVPVYRSLGSEFMPPLDEGSLLVMPTTFPGVSIEQARQVLSAQHRVLREQFPEVISVHGKAGRAETATDPAQLDMNESVVMLAPREQWPPRALPRWHSDRVPAWLEPIARRLWPEQRRYTTDELAAAIGDALRVPGYQMAIAPPIRTRIDMLTTGVRTPVGIKVFGDDLVGIEEISIGLEALLREVAGTRSAFAERQSGREYIDIVPDRAALARHGLGMAELHELIELAVGGMPVSTVIDGRARYTVNLRYGAEFRGDVDALRALPVPVPATEPVVIEATGAAGRGATTAVATASPAAGGDAMAGMGGAPMGGGSGGGMSPAVSGMPATNLPEFAPIAVTVPLAVLADVRVVTGPPMIKNENGQLVGYVFADIDAGQRDLGGWVEDAQRLVAAEFVLPPGYRLEWTGQYAFLADMQARLLAVIPLTLLLIVGLLYLALRGWAQTLLVLLSVPFAVVGSFWLLAALGYNLSTATWVGLIAVAGVAAQTAIVVIVYLDGAMREQVGVGPPSMEDIDAAVVSGALRGVRPMVMTVATTVLGLMPLMWTSGVGADLSARTAAPVVGGMLSALVLTLCVVPAAYAVWQRAHWRRRARVEAPTASERFA